MPESFETLSVPITLRNEHRLIFTRDVFAPENFALAKVLTPREPGEQVRALVFWDRGLEAAFPGFGPRISAWFAARGETVRLAAAPIVLDGGERAKNDFAQLERVWQSIEQAGLCRHSYVVVVGGGALLDLVGFAAATAHRGIPLIRLPSTSLSQGDGGVGVQNGVNFPVRERRVGLVEAVKVALIRDAAFFEFIAARVQPLSVFALEPFEAVIRESARQHMEHIATSGDPFERGSARPLDFGHWAAHKLEQLSDFALSHGEAVAVGMAVDLLYAKASGLLTVATTDRILGVMQQLGLTIYTPFLDLRGPDGRRRVLEGLEEFREHLGGRLSIPMIRAPGDRLEVHEMDLARVDAVIDELRAAYG